MRNVAVWFVLAAVLSSAISAAGQVTSQPRRPAEPSPEERAAYFRDRERWVTVDQDGLVVKFQRLDASVQLRSRLADVPVVRMSLAGEVLWSAGVGDVVVVNRLAVSRAEDLNGRSLLKHFPSGPLAQGHDMPVTWLVDEDRFEHPQTRKAPVRVDAIRLTTLPSGLGVLEGEVAVYRAAGATTTVIPLQQTMTPIAMAPGVEAEVHIVSESDGSETAEVTVTRPPLRQMGEFRLPHILPLGLGDVRDADSWNTRVLTIRSLRSEVAADGTVRDRWHLVPRERGALPVGCAIRVRVVPDLTYAPIPFSITNVNLSGEAEIPAGATIPRRATSSDALTLTFFDPYSTGPRRTSNKPGEVRLRAQFEFGKPGVYSLAPEPDIVSAVDDQGRLVQLRSGGVWNALSDRWTFRELSMPRPSSLADFVLDTADDAVSIDSLRGVWPVLRATGLTRKAMPLATAHTPVRLTESVRVGVRRISTDRDTRRFTLRVYVDTREAAGGLRLPHIELPLYRPLDAPGEPARVIVQPDQHSGKDSHGEWTEWSCTVPRQATSGGAELLFDIVESVEDLSIEFEVTDYPILYDR